MKHHNNIFKVSLPHRLAAWCVHIFTASGALVGLMALLAIYNHQWVTAFWLMGVSVIIDAVDGMFARMLKVKMAVPEVNGELLDNLVDFINYTIVPCFFLLVAPFLPEYWRYVCVIAITFSSAYQFTQVDAKTTDHFYKGFPSYWNIAVFYLFFWQFNEWTNLVILLLFSVLSFVPIKYIYPSRLDYLTHNTFLRLLVVIATVIWGLSSAGLLWVYPESNPILTGISMSYMILYVIFSLYRTWVPLNQHDHLDAREHSPA